MRFCCLVIALAFLAANASDSLGQSQQPPQIQTEQKTGQAKSDSQNSKVETAPVTTPSPSAVHSDQKPATENRKSGEEVSEGTEYWVYRGYKVKITDGLLVLFTLVVIGVFQAFYLSGTLKATATAAEAARLSVEAVVDADRAYLFVEIGIQLPI